MGSKTTFGPFVLDRERRQLTRGGHAVPVGHRGYTLLETLLDAGGDPVSKEALMERVWPGTVIEEGSLTVRVSALRRQLGDGSDAMIVTVPRVGYRLVAQAERPTPDRGGPPLIAVLPFTNYGDTAEDGYFDDGMVDDIITALARFKNFAVISRGASFALRDTGADARTAGSTLGVRYALEGSIRRLGDRLRVTAQLLDASTGAQLWAERYDGALAEVFSFQDRIIESVVGVIEPTVRKAEIERARRKPTQNLDAYDLLLRAMPLIYAPGIDRHPEAVALLKRSSELDPSYALPIAYMAWAYEKRISFRGPPLTDNHNETCLALTRRALAVGGDDPMIRAVCGFILYRVAGDPTGPEASRLAVRQSPNNVVVLQLASACIGVLGGNADEAIHYVTRAYELSPGAPDAYQCLQGIGTNELLRGNYRAAVDWCLKSLAMVDDWMFSYITLACAHAALDQMDDARAMLRRIRELNPSLTLSIIKAGAAPRDAYADAALLWLRKAGLPEG